MNGKPHHEHLEEELQTQTMSIRDVARVLGRYRTAIALTTLAVAALYLLLAVVLALIAPKRTVTEVPFRLEFKGSDIGQYPNGMKFSVSEIVSTPTLLSVYHKNSLKDFVEYQAFKNSIYVTEANPALEALEREYRAKLSDPKLASVDRAKLEEEFQQKKASVRRSEYMISYISASSANDLPKSLKVKVLADILASWAEQTVQNTGVVLYDLPILSSAIFERNILDKYDYVIAIDILRAKINRIIDNIDELSEIPGAKVVRTSPPSRSSLAELRVRLEDLLRFKVEPLAGVILRNGLSRSPGSSIDFLETRLRFNEIERKEAEARVDTLRRALQTYQQQGAEAAATGREAGTLPPQTVMPQMDATFFDRVIELSGEKNDMAFRQALVSAMQLEDLKVAPLEAEEQYYRVLIDSLRNVDSRAREAQPAELAALNTQVNAVVEDAIRTTDEVNQIYRTFSENLNPSTVLFSTTAPPVTRIERAYVPQRMALLGLLLLMVTVPMAAAGALVHNYLTGSDDDVVADERGQVGEAVAHRTDTPHVGAVR
jgi:hypothetical protein